MLIDVLPYALRCLLMLILPIHAAAATPLQKALSGYRLRADAIVAYYAICRFFDMSVLPLRHYFAIVEAAFATLLRDDDMPYMPRCCLAPCLCRHIAAYACLFSMSLLFACLLLLLLPLRHAADAAIIRYMLPLRLLITRCHVIAASAMRHADATPLLLLFVRTAADIIDACYDTAAMLLLMSAPLPPLLLLPPC